MTKARALPLPRPIRGVSPRTWRRFQIVPWMELAGPDAEPHWACPDCGQPCRCVGIIRRERHEPCGHFEL